MKKRVIFIVGNGPSLGKYPMHYLSRWPRFVMNYYPYYRKDVYPEPNYWTCWDTLPIGDCLPLVQGKCQVFLHPKDKEYLIKYGREGWSFRDTGITWVKFDERLEGFGYSKEQGTTYTSSIQFATMIAMDYLNFDVGLVVGLDCTTGGSPYAGKGIGGTPHWYDPDKDDTHYSRKWDEQMATLAKHYQEKGKSLINLNPWSRAKLFTPRNLLP